MGSEGPWGARQTYRRALPGLWLRELGFPKLLSRIPPKTREQRGHAPFWASGCTSRTESEEGKEVCQEETEGKGGALKDL